MKHDAIKYYVINLTVVVFLAGNINASEQLSSEAAKILAAKTNEKTIENPDVIEHVDEVFAEETAIEDLSSEHGIVERILLIYEEIKNLLQRKKEVDHQLLLQSAEIMRKFVEDYHEKTEEDYIFPLFENKKMHINLMRELRKQHTVGRSLTDTLLKLAKLTSWDKSQKRALIKTLDQFIQMYRFHISREDTYLFPEFRKLVSQEEYKRLGKLFDQTEDKLFGEGGYQKFLHELERIEKKLGIFDIAKFTPIIPKSAAG